MMKTNNLISKYKKLLGPIIEYYLFKLNYNIEYLDDGKTKFLFTTRAGCRILQLYNKFLSKKSKSPSNNCELFYASRFLIAKSFLISENEEIKKIIKKEYDGFSVKDFFSGIIRQDKDVSLDNFDLTGHHQDIHQFMDKNIFLENEPIRRYLLEENRKFTKYFNTILDGASRIVIIDSGWAGTIQSLLKNLYPDLEVLGLYFGTILEKSVNPYVQANSLGLIFEVIKEGHPHNTYDPFLPETAFSIHRHLIEDLFEPNAQSVEHLIHTKKGYIPAFSNGIHEESLSWKRDALFLSILEYLDERKLCGIDSLTFSYRKALGTLSQKIIFPKVEDIELIGGLQRSSDFGRLDVVPDIFPPKDRFIGDSPTLRIKEAIWPQGQVITEYPNYSSEKIQEIQLETATSKKIKPKGSVAVITRTKNRPILLERAAKSVSGQSYANYTWVVINDGGETKPVDKIVKNSLIDPFKIIVIHNNKSIGMEAASNKAIAQSNSDYIVIHDDDDSWDPGFLLKTVQYLDSEKGKKYGGVITDTFYVSESILDGDVIRHEQKPYNDWVSNVNLAEIINGNFYAPIAFLFRRKVYNKIKGYDETLPVLGDWDFNVRFLIEADIGVIKQPLAYYHHRDKNQHIASEYTNSVIGGVTKHREYDAIVRNKLIRSSFKKQDIAVFGAIAAMGYMTLDMRNRLNNIKSEISFKLNSEADEKIRETIKKEVREILGYEINKIFDFNYKEKNKECYSNFLSWGHQMGLIGKDTLQKKIRRLFSRKLYPSEFNEAAYLEKNPDVRLAIYEKKFKNGFHHYLIHGFKESRIF